MRKKAWRVTLTDTERTVLHDLLRAGKAPARKLTHARILLKADESSGGPGWSDRAITEALEISGPTVERVRKRYVMEGTRRRAEPSPVQGPPPPQTGWAPARFASRDSHY